MAAADVSTINSTVAIRLNGADYEFIDPVETLLRRHETDKNDTLSEEEVSALRSRFNDASNTLTAVDQALSGIASLMCSNDEDGIGKNAAINLSGLLQFLGEQVATLNKRMNDAHYIMSTNYDRSAMKKAASRANAKTA